jgi:hypothetical protein
MPINIPTYEPEIIKAEAEKRWRGDDEKVASTAIQAVKYKGIKLESRYQKADEFEAMAAGVDALPMYCEARIKSVYCDSKATLCYIIKMAESDDWWLRQAGRCFERGLLTHPPGGHNGIFVEDIHGEQSIEICPSWDE